jgi:PTS system galactitol-specific IIA component
MTAGEVTDAIRVESSLCVTGEDVADGEAALRRLAGLAVDQGFAAETFPDALLERERAYPTGLPLPMPVAIPHADAVHVRRPALAALAPPRRLTFGEMGSRDRTVEVGLVLMLLVDDPSQQVGLLSRLITALRQPGLEDALLDGLDSPGKLAERLNALLEAG